jgi:uncharacterized protein YjbI with pentapeptide repeats
MGNSTPQDSPQDRTNEARTRHPERADSRAANLPDNDFLETEEELDLDDIDWSMLTDLSTKINSGLDASTGDQSDTSTEASPLELDLPDWSDGGNEDEVSLAEMLDLEGLDDFDGELGELEEELGLGVFNDRDMTVVNASAEIRNAPSDEFEVAGLSSPLNPINELGELDDFGDFDDFDEEASITAEIQSDPSDRDVSWNLAEQDSQEFANYANNITNNDDDEPSWGEDEPNWDNDEHDIAHISVDGKTSYVANFADVPDYYADEVEPDISDREDIQTPSKDLISNFGEDTSGELFSQLPASRDIPNVQPEDIPAPKSSNDYDPSSSNWDFPIVSVPETSTSEINRDFSDLDATDEEFSDSTRIEDGGGRSLEGGDLSSERYSAAWEQELSSSYYSESTEHGQEESFEPATADEDWALSSDRSESPNLVSTDTEEAFEDSDNFDWQEELGQALDSDSDLFEADDTDINRSAAPEVPQVLPPLPPLPPLPSLPSLDSPRPSQPTSNPSRQTKPENKSQRGFEQFDLPDLEWEETVSPRLGDDTGFRKGQSVDPPSTPKAGPRPGTSEYKKGLSENLSSDMSWSEILDMQPDISAEPLNIPSRKPADPTNQSNRSNFAPPDPRQSRSPAHNPNNDLPVDRVDRIGQMGAFSDPDNSNFNTPDFAAMAESLGADDLMPPDRPAKPRKPSINIPELWDRYGQNLKIPAIALGAIAAVMGLFSIPPIKRFTVETGLRIGFNKDASGQDLSGINFKGGNLEKVNFTNANLTNANLESVNLKGATLVGTKLDGANLQKADLKGARMVDASLVKANLTSAALNLADLSNANLAKANLTKANMNGVLLKGSKIEPTTKIDPEDKLMWQIVNEPKANRNLAGINMTGFNLSSANLQGARLTNAKLTWSDLSKSDLSNAKLDGTDLSGANLQGANLKGANLVRATWSKDRAPKTDNQTICPNSAQGPCKL